MQGGGRLWASASGDRPAGKMEVLDDDVEGGDDK